MSLACLPPWHETYVAHGRLQMEAVPRSCRSCAYAYIASGCATRSVTGITRKCHSNAGNDGVAAVAPAGRKGNARECHAVGIALPYGRNAARKRLLPRARSGWAEVSGVGIPTGGNIRV